MMNDENYISIVLGETGVGKSSLINLITSSLNCKISDVPEMCTKYYNMIRTFHNGSEFYFIDTPGFNDYRSGKELYLNELRKAITKFPRIRCLIILYKFQEKRITQTFLEFLKILMECFPTKQFWFHVIIVRTFSYSRDLRKNKERNRLKFNDVKNIINAPEVIKEYYIDCDEEDNGNFEYNIKELEEIFNVIRMTRPIN